MKLLLHKTKYLHSLSSKYWISVWIDLPNAFASMHLSLIIQASLLLLPYSPLLPSVQDSKYMHISAKEVLGLNNVIVLVEMCWWIAYIWVFYSLYINIIFAATGWNESCLRALYESVVPQFKVETLEVSQRGSLSIQELCMTLWYRLGFVCMGFLYNRGLKENLRGQ